MTPAEEIEAIKMRFTNTLNQKTFLEVPEAIAEAISIAIRAVIPAEIGEAEGWEILEKMNKEAIVSSCCPEDDAADSWNTCRSEMIRKAREMGVEI